MSQSFFIQTFTWLVCAVFSSVAWSQVDVSYAWARASVQGQRATGAFMKISSKDGAKIVGISSAVAGVAEIHEMKMEKDVMKMASIPVLDIPAGKTIELKPGGYHLMLMDLKNPLNDKTTVAITLTVENLKGVQSRLELQVPVKSMGMRPGH